MLWFRHALLFCSIIFVQSCGYEPLYQKSDVANTAGSELSTIIVKPISDRIGQKLRNHLYDALTPAGKPKNPKWELNVTLQESIQKIALEQTSFSTRANLTLSGTFHLTAIGANDVKGHAGSVSVISSYNIFDSEYATLIAERDARSKAVLILSNDIRRALAIWFNNRENDSI